MFNKRTVSLILASILLSGCGGGGDSSDNSSESQGPTALELSQSGILGVWQSSDILRDNDEWYLVINSEGEFVYYDYMGDSFNQGNNCFDKTAHRLVSVDQSSLSYYDTEEKMVYSASYEIINNKLSFERAGEFFGTDLHESDLSPICR